MRAGRPRATDARAVSSARRQHAENARDLEESAKRAELAVARLAAVVQPNPRDRDAAANLAIMKRRAEGLRAELDRIHGGQFG